jgi:hypothetical protein
MSQSEGNGAIGGKCLSDQTHANIILSRAIGYLPQGWLYLRS